MVASWTVGYVIGEIPSNMILTRVRPSIWIPTLEVCVWTILTMCMSRCNNVSQVYALRFLGGSAESGFYPGMQYMIGSWYRKDELAKRSCILYHLGGRAGLKGWQWLFIIDDAISFPIAMAGYLMLPDVPEIARAWYFSQEVCNLASLLTGTRGIAGSGAEKATYQSKDNKILSSWRIYAPTLSHSHIDVTLFIGVNEQQCFSPLPILPIM
ncbi:hypothetical protein DSL72_006462 [Monilinia vaccinii-corymbosi]|uniref:Uncharacterized protein n=1 Tax=Monilinia vaccinii-corymbosi TaxID=61207 RepID=A0A8A3PMA1_9HELO|nr:hypothetical protein DSL72_006462 [Monilinia vaccinii-corymbosi]